MYFNCVVSIYVGWANCHIKHLRLKDVDITDLISILPVHSSSLIALIGILKIISKYYFDTSDEKYITDIVKIIQENDFKNKKENIKVAIEKPEKRQPVKIT